jgi:hypothetical protein
MIRRIVIRIVFVMSVRIAGGFKWNMVRVFDVQHM